MQSNGTVLPSAKVPTATVSLKLGLLKTVAARSCAVPTRRAAINFANWTDSSNPVPLASVRVKPSQGVDDSVGGGAGGGAGTRARGAGRGTGAQPLGFHGGRADERAGDDSMPLPPADERAGDDSMPLPPADERAGDDCATLLRLGASATEVDDEDERVGDDNPPLLRLGASATKVDDEDERVGDDNLPLLRFNADRRVGDKMEGRGSGALPDDRPPLPDEPPPPPEEVAWRW